MDCPECGALASDDDLFCGECGAILATAMADEQVDEPALDLPLAPPPPAPPPDPSLYAPATRDSRARIAFILGIVSIASVVLTCLPFFGMIGCIGPVIGIVAIVLGAMVKRDIDARGGLEEDRKQAHQGMIMGIVGVAIYGVFLVIAIVFSIGIGLLDSF
jgi:hypothetical protein